MGTFLRGIRRSVYVSGIVVVVVAGVTGCAGIGAGTASASSPSPSIHSTPTPEATTAAPTQKPTSTASVDTALPAYDDLVVSSGGINTLHVGVSPSTSSMVTFSAKHCDADPLYANSGGYPGPVSDRWLANYPDFGGSGFLVSAIDVVTRIDVRDPAITTAEGVGVGTSEADLEKAYGDRLTTVHSGSLSEVRALVESQGTLVFEVAKSTTVPDYWPADEVDRVAFVRVLSAGTDPAFATAGTDNQAGSCV